MENLVKNSVKAAATAAALAIACAFVAPKEGLWLTAKVDKIGTGRPVTAKRGSRFYGHGF